MAADRRPGRVCAGLVLALVVAGCATPPDLPRSPGPRSLTPTTGQAAAGPVGIGAGGTAAGVSPAAMMPAPERKSLATAGGGAEPRISRISDRQWQRMRAARVVRPGCPAGRADLRVVAVNFHGFDGKVHRGRLVVNRDVASEVAAIFSDLYRARFPIRRMRPIEAYRGDDNASMAADNTSAYNCRRASQANASPAKSPHANGRAVDINPRENPWWDPRCGCFQPEPAQAPRRPGKGKILSGGVVWRAFTSRGWIWQDIATPDYQHFDTGYPSRPRKSAQ